MAKIARQRKQQQQQLEEEKGRQESGRAASIIVALGSALHGSTCPTTELGVVASTKARAGVGLGIGF